MVLRSCQYLFNSETNKIEDLTEASRQSIEQIIVEMATKSLRTLCLGYRKLNPKDDFTIKDEKGVY
jgi:magnesium-transporting ATPase (P-type)